MLRGSRTRASGLASSRLGAASKAGGARTRTERLVTGMGAGRGADTGADPSAVADEVGVPERRGGSANRYLHPATRLRSLGLRPRKGLSQSFLADQGVARAIVKAADLDPTSVDVLEVGPGLGVLTERLAPRARRLVAVEVDPSLAAALADYVAAPNLAVIERDILQFEPGEVFAEPYVVVANLPYRITSPVIRHLLAAGPPFAKRLVVMVQAEVAERIAAQPGQLSALALAVQAQASVEIVLRVPARSFYPPPKVDSAVLRIAPLADEQRLISREAVQAFTDVLHAGFAQPRKRLGNSLAQGLKATKSDAETLLARAEIDPTLRAEMVPLAAWARLFAVLRDEAWAGGG